MKDARSRDWELIQEVRHLPYPKSDDYEQDLIAWRRAWEELLSVELIDKLRLSLQLQFPAEQNRDDRENALQDTLLKFYERTGWNYDPEKAGQAGLLGYLGKIAYQQTKALREKSYPISENDVSGVIAEDPHSERALREVDFNDWFEWLQNALAPEDREIVQLRIAGGLTFQKIADHVGKPVSTVHDIWHRLCACAAKFERGDDDG